MIENDGILGKQHDDEENMMKELKENEKQEYIN